MDYLTNLPNEILIMIFKNLNLSDLYHLNFVHGPFRALTTESVTDLIVRSHPLYGNCWYLTYDIKSLSKYDTVEMTRFSLFRKQFNLKSSLKRLHLNASDNVFDYLNDFKQLEHLELACVLLESETLNLFKLKTFQVGCISINKETKLKLKSKKLENLFVLNNLNQIEIIEPNTVKHFKLDFEDADCDFSLFSNLEHLVLGNYGLLSGRNYISMFKKLKVLELYDYESHDEPDLIESILNQREQLRRTDLIIRLNGVEITSTNQLIEIERQGSLIFRYNNYDQLTGYLYDDELIDQLEFNILIGSFNLQIPRSIFSKYFNISCVCFNNLEATQENVCSWFLNNLVCLKNLSIYNCLFGQQFYDELVECKYLDDFGIFETSNETLHRSIDFNFVTKFKELVSFSSDLKPNNPYDLAVKIFENSNYFKEFKFKALPTINERITKKNDVFQFEAFKCVFRNEKKDEIRLLTISDLTKDDLIYFLKKINVEI